MFTDDEYDYLSDNGMKKLLAAMEKNNFTSFSEFDEKLLQEGLKNNDGVQFSHTFEEQIGGQLRAGFMLTDVYEDTDGFGPLQEYNIPTFWATRAVKK